jgi:hypothetical protein
MQTYLSRSWTKTKYWLHIHILCCQTILPYTYRLIHDESQPDLRDESDDDHERVNIRFKSDLNQTFLPLKTYLRKSRYVRSKLLKRFFQWSVSQEHICDLKVRIFCHAFHLPFVIFNVED